MMVWWMVVGCGSTETVAPPAPAPAPAAVAPEPVAKAKKGKGKNKARGRARGACPQGVVTNLGWEGEYPSPVVEVTKPVSLKASADPCADPTMDCAVPAGLYHPWSQVEVDYATVRSVEKYRAKHDTTVGETAVKSGEEVTVTQYLSEGYCIVEVAGKDGEAECPLDADFEKLPGREVPTRQLIEFSCGGTSKGWVDAAELMKAPGVQEGKVVEWGTVGPG